MGQRVDIADVINARVIDVSPGDDGARIAAIAIKSDGNTSAYAFSSESYGFDLLQKTDWALSHERYEVEIVAEAGGVKSPVTRFTLENIGTAYTGLRLIPR